MNAELILALLDAANTMKKAAIIMFTVNDIEHRQHAAELYGSAEIVEQWIKKLEG